jgi:hypothetical protein
MIKAVPKRPVSHGATGTQTSVRGRIAAFAFAAVAGFALILPASSPAEAAGRLPNCAVLVTAAPCWETVWANGKQFRMLFPQAGTPYPGPIPTDQVVGNFYVVAPQGNTPQGTVPFLHDHTVGNVPADNQQTGEHTGNGNQVIFRHGFFVFCSAAGIASGACVTGGLPPFPGFPPFAKTVNGQPLTSLKVIESPANSQFLMLFDTGATFLGIITNERNESND